jgi:outer membrane murein-binding lipoprotein Lpp
MPSATPIIKDKKEQMQNKIKIVSLTLFATIGLLLGGNVFADGGPSQTANFDAISAQIELVRQKIDQLSAELKNKQTSVSAPAPAAELTQEKLDYIEGEIRRVARETERLKIEVAIFVTLKEVERKTAMLAAQIASGTPVLRQSIAATAPRISVGASVAAAPAVQTREEIEAQVADIKQKINELTQEMQARTETETSPSAPAAEVLEGMEDENGGDSSNSKTITISPSGEKTQTNQEKPRSFWESAGDFLKKLFTF